MDTLFTQLRRAVKLAQEHGRDVRIAVNRMGLDVLEAEILSESLYLMNKPINLAMFMGIKVEQLSDEYEQFKAMAVVFNDKSKHKFIVTLER